MKEFLRSEVLSAVWHWQS